jgi:rubrerythrin
MPKNIHKGTELNNVRETWEQNEKRDVRSKVPKSTDENLERIIEEEASEYENANKEDRLLGGERATVNDDSES